MSERIFSQVEFGESLPSFKPNMSLDNVKRFVHAAQMDSPRFTDHAAAREQGMPGAIVPGIMSQGILVALIHRWAPNAVIHSVDTIFRAPLIADSQPVANAVVTDIDEETRVIELDLTLHSESGETPVIGTAKISLEPVR